MVYHVLNGDALTDRFLATGIGGETVITRECLIDGSLNGDTLSEFYQTRAKYIKDTLNENEEAYYAGAVNEFEKLSTAAGHAEFNLWFGYDLFCRANMWFILSLLNDLETTKEIFVVYPSYLGGDDVWKDFGSATPADLITCYNQRVKFDDEDLALGNNLWIAYKNNDLDTLEKLSRQHSVCFPYLQEVCKAHIERFPKNNEKSRPEKVIEEIIQSGTRDFYSVFSKFFSREGIYGFGDDQLKQIYDKVMLSHSDQGKA